MKTGAKTSKRTTRSPQWKLPYLAYNYADDEINRNKQIQYATHILYCTIISIKVSRTSGYDVTNRESFAVSAR